MEAVMVSHYSLISPVAIAGLGLLYDRVVLPLADWSAGDHPLARPLSRECPAVKRLVLDTRAFRESEHPLCRALTSNDLPSGVLGEGGFKESFTSFNEQHSIDFEELLHRQDLDSAFQTLQIFIASLLITGHTAERVPVFWVDNYNYIDALEHKLVIALDTDLLKWRVPSIEVAPDKLGVLRRIVSSCPDRETYRQKLFSVAKRIRERLDLVGTSDPHKRLAEQRAIILDELTQLKVAYEAWSRKLAALETLNMTRIGRTFVSLLEVAKSVLTAAIPQAATIDGKANVQSLGTISTHLAWSDKQILAARKPLQRLCEHAKKTYWQRHLFVFESKTRELF